MSIGAFTTHAQQKPAKEATAKLLNGLLQVTKSFPIIIEGAFYNTISLSASGGAYHNSWTDYNENMADQSVYGIPWENFEKHDKARENSTSIAYNLLFKTKFTIYIYYDGKVEAQSGGNLS